MSDPQKDTVPILLKHLSPPTPSSTIPCLQIVTGESAGLVVPLARPETTVGRDEACDLRLDETGISRRHACLRVAPGKIVTLEDLGSTNGTYIGETRVAKVSLNKGDSISFGGVVQAKFDLRTREDIELAESVYELSLRDPLTKALKRDAFIDFLSEQRAVLLRRPSRSCLFLVEVDRFEQLEEVSVREVGDVLLKQLADILRKSTRLGDVLGRYERDSFAIYLHGIEPDQVPLVARRICKHASEHPFQLTKEGRVLTFQLRVSIGGAEWSGSSTVEALRAQAELSLGHAQKSGGNGFEISPADP